MKNEKRISLYLVTGFLGSGKTTVLKKLLDCLQGRKIGVIVNEFGKVSIDGSILEDDSLDILEINQGSIFCSCLQGSFEEGLIEYASLPIETLFVECSGLADPSSMELILEHVKTTVGSMYDYKGSVCVVDAARFFKVVEIVRAVERQLTYSNLILLNKSDLISDEERKEIEKKIRQINPFAAVIPTVFGNIDMNVLEKELADFALPGAEESTNCSARRPKTFLLRAEGIFKRDDLKSFLSTFASDTFRVKGFFHLVEGWVHVDGVGEEIEFKPANIARQQSELVVIMRVRDPIIRKLRENWSRFFQEELTIES